MLDFLPHLLDRAVESLVGLLFRVDEVVGVVSRLVRWAARLGGGCGGGGVDGGRGG